MFNKILFAAFISLFSLPVLSAKEITRKDASQYIKIGNASVSGQSTSNEAISALREKAIEVGAQYFLVSSLTMPGDSSKWSATAVLYKDN
ncbi:YdgH/BhsA/McbA-like domain containing protein [Serratia ureilytica]|uniref:YdgH/BhsA/McbA-like domain containing protein n=1 Tax=Serratia ureilytica TaxID=300181 RepID=UPI001C1292D3|nr:YdgH/BhsA/McbA-like domain containing protein [Serratia ureilytica]MBU5412448.1 DUF1471 domain-containing protein [Serratia ureilytica]